MKTLNTLIIILLTSCTALSQALSTKPSATTGINMGSYLPIDNIGTASTNKITLTVFQDLMLGYNASTRLTAQQHLQLEPGVNVQGFDAGLAFLDGLNFTNESTFKAGLNLEIGTDIQGYDAGLSFLDGLNFTNEATFKTSLNITGTDDQTASEVNILDSDGHFISGNVEGALDELGDLVNGTASFSADIDMGGNIITNLVSPAISSDAATKGYVDAAISGIPGTDDQTASEVPITDTGGNYTATDVEGALAEIVTYADGLLGNYTISSNTISNGSNPILLSTSSYVDILGVRSTSTETTFNSLLKFSNSGKTISSGAITITRTLEGVSTEGGAGTDDLETINGGVNGEFLIIRAGNAGNTVVVKDGVGNLSLNGDFTMDSSNDTMMLVYIGSLSVWLELSRSDNGS